MQLDADALGRLGLQGMCLIGRAPLLSEPCDWVLLSPNYSRISKVERFSVWCSHDLPLVVERSTSNVCWHAASCTALGPLSGASHDRQGRSSPSARPKRQTERKHISRRVPNSTVLTCSGYSVRNMFALRAQPTRAFGRLWVLAQ